MAYALITGASKGIGKSLATALAAKQYDLLLVARSGDELEALAKDLKAKYKVRVDWLAQDLSLPDAAESVVNWCNAEQYALSILINNAGYGVWGPFETSDLHKQSEMLQVNMHTPVELCYRLLPLLKAQSKSYILNVSSTAAYQAVPTFSLYAASKAFILLFTRGLRQELKGSRVSVTCLSPGPVNTNFIDRAGLQAIKATAEKFGMHPDTVAAIALKGMFRGKSEIIPGAINAISAFSTRLFPKSIVETIAASFYKKK
jgi:short-subunit dehydrogenase